MGRPASGTMSKRIKPLRSITGSVGQWPRPRPRQLTGGTCTAAAGAFKYLAHATEPPITFRASSRPPARRVPTDQRSVGEDLVRTSLPGRTVSPAVVK